MHGLEHEVRAAVSMIMDLDMIKVGMAIRGVERRLNRNVGIPP